MRPKYTFPANYGEDCVIIEIDKGLVPHVMGAFKHFEQRNVWESETDYQKGYNAFAELREQLMGKCIDALVESNDRLYRLLDTALTGTVYMPVFNPSTGETTVNPPVPITPSPAAPTSPFAMRAHISRLRQLAENAATGQEFAAGSALNGTVALDFDGSWRARLEALQGTTGGFFGFGDTPTTLTDLLQAGRVNNTADQGVINDGFEEILGALSSGGNIGSVLTNILSAGADAATDGGVIAATLAAALANAVTTGALAAQLDRVIKALDGGGLLAPSDNILQALRGTEESTATRNVVELVAAVRDHLAPEEEPTP